MLVTSRTFGRRCPVCGAANHACGGPSDAAGVDQRITNAPPPGPMALVPLGRGLSMRVRVPEPERDAPAKRQDDADDKAERPARNKRRRASRNKSVSAEE